MKLIEIEIIGFGKWQQKIIPFQKGNQLLYGTNEVGKSTIYQFIQTILFGFPTKGKRKKDYQPKNGGAYGGRVRLEHPVYGEVLIERFKEKQRGQATVYFNDQKGDEQIVKKILHPLTKELFQRVFTFQQEQLNRIDKLDEEQLQQSLLSLGVSGSHQMLIKREDYLKTAQTIYKGKGSQPLLNQKLTEYHSLQQKITEKEQQEQTFQTVNEELEVTQKQLEQLINKIQQMKQETEQVEKQVRNFSMYEELQQLERGDQTTSIEIPSHDQQKLNDIYQQYQFLNQEILRLNYTMARLNDEDELIDLYSFYLEQEQTIQQFLQKRYDIEKLVDEIEWMQESIKKNQASMLPLEKQWGWYWQQPPQLFFDEKQAEGLREEKIARMVKLQTVETDIKLLEEEIDSREKNLSTFEKLHPQLLQHKQKKKTTHLLLFLLSFSTLISTFFTPSPIRYLFLFVSIVFLSLGLWLGLHFPKSKDEKQQWREKLSQLDYSNEQLLELKEKMQTISNQEEIAEKNIMEQAAKHHLGKMNRVEDWTNHRTDITRYLILVNENQELEQQLNSNQETVVQLIQQTEPYLTKLPIAGKSLKERLILISNFADRMEKVRFEQEHQADSYTRQALKEVKEKQKDLIVQSQNIIKKYHIPTVEEIPIKLQHTQTFLNEQKRKQEIQKILGDLYNNVSIDKENEFLQYYEQLKKDLNRLEKEYQETLRKEQELLYHYEQMMKDGTLDELRQDQAELKTVIEELSSKWFGYQLSALLLMDLLTELSEQQLPNLLKKATEFFRLLTNNMYHSVYFFEGQLMVTKNTHQKFMIYDLSTGTKDQLIMAIRLAFIFMQGEQSICPVMIDDGWLHYDSFRKQQLAELLALFGKKNQVICFSSDQEMVSYYKALKQPTIELEGV